MKSMLSKYYFNKEDRYELISLETLNVFFLTRGSQETASQTS
jgi:hypothetical protein